MLELNSVTHGVVSPHAQRKTGDAVGEHKLEKTLNTRDEGHQESAKAVAKTEETRDARRSLPPHLGKRIDTEA